MKSENPTNILGNLIKVKKIEQISKNQRKVALHPGYLKLEYPDLRLPLF